MVEPKDVDAVLVTHRNVDLSRIVESLAGFRSIVVWDNEKLNMGPLGQFIAAAHIATSNVVYFQDDDCVTDPREIVSRWRPDIIVCNMGTQGHRKNYEDRPDKLMGFGSCFRRTLVRQVFEAYWSVHPISHVSWREPGRIFTTIVGRNPGRVEVVEVPVRHLPWAEGSDRLYRQSEHVLLKEVAVGQALDVPMPQINVGAELWRS